MAQEFMTALAAAGSVMATIAAYLVALLGLLGCGALAILVLAWVFDLATELLAWLWRVTKRRPRGRIARIIMRQRRDV